MEHSNTSYDKTVALLLKEASLTTTCIEQGLTSLRKASFQNKAAYYQAFFLLSIGIERLLKIIIITIYRTEEDKLPNNNDLKNYGHDIEKLFLKVASHLRPSESFLDDDDLNKKIISFLSDYARHNRYYNLDSLTGIEKSEDPLYMWSKIQSIIEKRHGKPREFGISTEVVNALNNNFFFRTSNEEGREINSASAYLLELANVDIIQGYSVYYIYQVICYLIDLLDSLSDQKHLLPYYREFFTLFIPPMLPKDIIRRKNWNYSVTKR